MQVVSLAKELIALELEGSRVDDDFLGPAGAAREQEAGAALSGSIGVSGDPADRTQSPVQPARAHRRRRSSADSSARLSSIRQLLFATTR
jgi:hypothetical protein